MKIIGCIPARIGSTRLPAKPLALVGDTPLVLHVAERVSKSELLTDVVVLTDDEQILNLVREAGFKAELTSPDCQSGTDRIIEYAHRHPADYYVNIQGDEVFMEPASIDHLIRTFTTADPQAIGTLDYPIPSEKAKAPNVVKVVKNSDDLALYFSRSVIPMTQTGEPPAQCLCHMGIYIYTSAALKVLSTLPVSPLESIEKLEQLRALEYGLPIKAFTIAAHAGFGVDTPADLARANALISEMA